MTEPEAGRPHMPGYGISPETKGALPWEWAEERLRDTRNYFVATTRPDGRPHVMPVWAIWLNGLLWFSTARTSTKARNLLTNPNITISAERGPDAVILEGTATIEENTERLRPVWEAYKAKYEWDMEGESMFTVSPRTVFAFVETADDFAATATRWRFAPS